MAIIDMKAINALQHDADVKQVAYEKAYIYAMQNHTAYLAALKTSQAVYDAYETLRVKVQSIISSLGSASGANDPLSDSYISPDWWALLTKIRDKAIQYRDWTWQARQALLADMAGHLKAFGPQFSSPTTQLDVFNDPYAAAAKADALPAYTPRGVNPNAQTPGKQDSASPPVEAPPVDASASPPWGLIAAGAAVGAVAVKLLGRFL